MTENVNLFHGTEYGNLEEIEEEGLKTRESRGEVPDLANEDAMKYQSIYLYDPDHLSDWIKDDFNDVFVECSVPKDELYVARYGDDLVEAMPLEEAEERLNSYEALESGNLSYGNDSLMFLHPQDIGPDQLHALAWSI